MPTLTAAPASACGQESSQPAPHLLVGNTAAGDAPTQTETRRRRLLTRLDGLLLECPAERVPAEGLAIAAQYIRDLGEAEVADRLLSLLVL